MIPYHVQTYAKWFVLAVIAILLAYEVYAIFDKRQEDSISAVVWAGVQNSTLVPLLGGLLCGHFFFQSGIKSAVAFLLGLTGGALGWRASKGVHL